MAAETRTWRWAFVAATAAASFAYVAVAVSLREHFTSRPADAVAVAAPAASPAPVPAAPSRGPESAAAPSRPEPVIAREIRVLVACDEEFRRRGNWRENATSLVRLASIPWEREFGIRWTPASVVEWRTDDDAATLPDLRSHLADTVPLGSADVALGLTGQDRARGAATQYAALGVSDYFGRAAVVGVGWPECWGREPNAVAHEFGHLFGAWHCATRNTIMTAPSADLTRFDVSTLALIPLVRDLDFRAGLDWLDDRKIAAISELWKVRRAPDAQHPVAEALLVRGWQRAKESQTAGALADFEKSLAILASCGVTKGARVSSCLVGTALAYERRQPPDVARSLEFARRGRDVAGDDEEDPVGSSWMGLGHALWLNDRNEEAVDAYTQALSIRRARLGAYDSLTNEARQALQWFAAHGSVRAAALLSGEAAPLTAPRASPK